MVNWLFMTLFPPWMNNARLDNRHTDTEIVQCASQPHPRARSADHAWRMTTVGNPSTCFLSPPDSCNLLSLRSLFFYLLFSPFGVFGSDNGKLHEVWKQIRYVNQLNDKQCVYILQLLWFKDSLRLANDIISILRSFNRSTIRWYLTYM